MKKKIKESKSTELLKRPEQLPDIVKAYKKALADLLKICNNLPSTEALEGEVKKLEYYVDQILATKRSFLALDNRLLKENSDNPEDINSENINLSEAGFPYQAILDLSDKLIELKDIIHGLQFQLFDIAVQWPRDKTKTKICPLCGTEIKNQIIVKIK
jgi:hypothetical protein